MRVRGCDMFRGDQRHRGIHMHWSAKVLCWVVAMSLQSGSYVVLQRLLRGGDQRPRRGRERKTSMQIRRQFLQGTPQPPRSRGRCTHSGVCEKKAVRACPWVHLGGHPPPSISMLASQSECKSVRKKKPFFARLSSLRSRNIEIGAGVRLVEIVYEYVRTAFFSQTPV